MMHIHFLGVNNKPDRLEIHQGIVKNYTILGSSLVIEFKRSDKTLAAKKTLAKDLVTWTWTKNINDISNYSAVMAFLKSLNLGNEDKIIAPKPIDNTQQTLF